jgi:hypothetical protein
MSKTLKEAGIDVLGVTPFCKKVGLDENMTIEELQMRLEIADKAIAWDSADVYVPTYGGLSPKTEALLQALIKYEDWVASRV